MAARPRRGALRTFHSQLVAQANAYMNATWAVAVAKAGDEDGSGLIGGSCIVDPNGVIVAQASTLGDEVLVADCDLDQCRQGKDKMFNFAAHRRPEHYRAITERAGVVEAAMIRLVLVLLALGSAQAAELPSAIRQAGVLHLTVNATYAPMEYHDPVSNELIGLDIDLANGLAKRLGVGIVWSDTSFEQLLPSLQTGRSDFIISGFSDRRSRRDVADFVDYLTTGAQFFVLADSMAKTPADLCGRKVGTVRSTSFPIELDKWSHANCEAAGKTAVDYVPGENSIDVRNQLKQGRIDAAIQGSETLPYAQQNEPGRYRILGAPFTVGYQGIAFRKDDAPLREAVTDALRGMIADGSYPAVLAKYGLSANAVPQPLLNAATQ